VEVMNSILTPLRQSICLKKQQDILTVLLNIMPASPINFFVFVIGF